MLHGCQSRGWKKSSKPIWQYQVVIFWVPAFVLHIQNYHSQAVFGWGFLTHDTSERNAATSPVERYENLKHHEISHVTDFARFLKISPTLERFFLWVFTRLEFFHAGLSPCKGMVANECEIWNPPNRKKVTKILVVTRKLSKFGTGKIDSNFLNIACVILLKLPKKKNISFPKKTGVYIGFTFDCHSHKSEESRHSTS